MLITKTKHVQLLRKGSKEAKYLSLYHILFKGFALFYYILHYVGMHIAGNLVNSKKGKVERAKEKNKTRLIALKWFIIGLTFDEL